MESLKMQWVSAGFNMPAPFEYEFQVLEMYDVNDETKIKKVTLQVRKNNYDAQGYFVSHDPWKDVPRLRMPYDGRK